jgi:acyl-CoA synthetase (AMP-forming)/AMP-acid ligase II
MHERPGHPTVGEQLARVARQWGSRPAIREPGRELSYRELDSVSNRMANGMGALGVGVGDRVALVLGDRSEWIVTDLALAVRGAVTVPLDARSTDEELRQRLQLVDPRAAVVHASDCERVREILPGVPVVVVDGRADRHGPDVWDLDALMGVAHGPPPAVALDANSAARLIKLTSGTTGRPKGVVLTHRNWLTGAYNLLLDRYLLTDRDVFLGTSPFVYASGPWLMAAMLRGACVAIPDGRDAASLLAAVEHHRATVLQVVPTMLRRLLDAAGPDVPQLRTVQAVSYGSGPLGAKDIADALARIGPRLVQGYGLTEAPNLTAMSPRDHQVYEFGVNEGQPIGREGTLVQAKVVDDAGSPVGNGELGELAVRGDMVMPGYWRDARATEEVIRDGWMLTGDLVRRGEDGMLYLVDRKKEVIISGGLNVYPYEVEAVLRRQPGVGDCAVVGLPHPEWGEQVTAFVVSSGQRPSAAQLIEACGATLSAYKKPKDIRFVDELPKNNNGKVARRVLRERYGSVTG